MAKYVEVERDVLHILLEYAYRGESAQGGDCRNDRDEHCAACFTFTEAERALGIAPAPEDLNWWTPPLRERWWRLKRRLRR